MSNFQYVGTPVARPGDGEFGRSGTVVSIPTVTVQLDVLGQFCREAAGRMGIPPDSAEIFVDVLLSGSLRSLPGQGQGVQQLPTYDERIRGRVIDVDARLEVSSRHAGVA